PELHAATLSDNFEMIDAINAHVARGKSVLAECGGMLYLADTLCDLDGNEYDMLGLLPGDVMMNRKLNAIGSQEVIVNGTAVRGHTFHYSSFDTELEPLTHATLPEGRQGEAVYQID